MNNLEKQSNNIVAIGQKKNPKNKARKIVSVFTVSQRESYTKIMKRNNLFATALIVVFICAAIAVDIVFAYSNNAVLDFTKNFSYKVNISLENWRSIAISFTTIVIIASIVIIILPTFFFKKSDQLYKVMVTQIVYMTIIVYLSLFVLEFFYVFALSAIILGFISYNFNKLRHWPAGSFDLTLQ